MPVVRVGGDVSIVTRRSPLLRPTVVSCPTGATAAQAPTARVVHAAVDPGEDSSDEVIGAHERHLRTAATRGNFVERAAPGEAPGGVSRPYVTGWRSNRARGWRPSTYPRNGGRTL